MKSRCHKMVSIPSSPLPCVIQLRCGSSGMIVRRSWPYDVAVQAFLCLVALVYAGVWTMGWSAWLCARPSPPLQDSCWSACWVWGNGVVGAVGTSCVVHSPQCLMAPRCGAALPLCGLVGHGCAAVLHSLAPHSAHYTRTLLLACCIVPGLVWGLLPWARAVR